MKTFLAVVALALGAAPVQDMPAEKLEQHDWLQQLVGEWTMKSEATMGPGTEPIQLESTETVRSIGGLWTVAEGTANIGGMKLTSIMTLGYDPEKKQFVGSWIDTMHTNLWVYEGQLDDAKKVLTLSTTGPSFDDASKKASYRDAIEIKDKDNRVLTSSVQGDDGKWTTFMTAHYTRKK